MSVISRQQIGRLTVRMLAGLGMVMMIVMLTPLVSWWGRILAGPWEDPTGDVLIVLGGSVQSDGLMGESSYWRSVYAILTYRQGGFQTIVLSGGGSSGTPIVGPMKDFLRCHGIPADVIRLEPYSRDTRENAVYTRDMLAGMPGRKVLLTSDYHMTRAYRAFRKAGLEVVPRPFPDVIKRAQRWQTRWSAFIDLTRETAALGYYFVRGWV